MPPHCTHPMFMSYTVQTYFIVLLISRMAYILFPIAQSSCREKIWMFLLFLFLMYYAVFKIASSRLHDVLLVLRWLTDNLRRREDELRRRKKCTCSFSVLIIWIIICERVCITAVKQLEVKCCWRGSGRSETENCSSRSSVHSRETQITRSDWDKDSSCSKELHVQANFLFFLIL